MEPFSPKSKTFIHIKKTRRKKVPEKTIAFLIFKNQRQEVFLKKRPGKGIWGGLWSFEECDDNIEAIDLAVRQHNNGAKIIQSLAKFKHTFSHFTLWINPVLIDSPGGSTNYYETSNLALGTPVPVKKDTSGALIDQ